MERTMKARPKIILSATDAERLDQLLAAVPKIEFFGRDELEAELANATVVEPQQVPPTVVTMNSTVRFTVASSQQEFELTLVYPKDRDTSEKSISILSPVGSALLGLAQGDEIEWPAPGGGLVKVRVKEVVYQPERTGVYHR